jgi:predicted AAA+ superfamily ATPase
VRGGWPALIDREPLLAREALIDYLANIAAVDMRTLKSPPDPFRMAALIFSLARNIATEASLEKLAAEADIHEGSLAAKTVRKYLDQLAQIFILDELPAWQPRIRSSIRARVKPKWHFADPSLAAAALRITPKDLLNDLETMGFFFESMVIRDLRAYADMIEARVFHYRDSRELEIDAIIERFDGVWAAVEVKLGGAEAIEVAVGNFARLRNRLTRQRIATLSSFNVVTAGKESYTREDGVNVIALGHMFSGDTG